MPFISYVMPPEPLTTDAGFDGVRLAMSRDVAGPVGFKGFNLLSIVSIFPAFSAIFVSSPQKFAVLVVAIFLFR